MTTATIVATSSAHFTSRHFVPLFCFYFVKISVEEVSALLGNLISFQIDLVHGEVFLHARTAEGGGPITAKKSFLSVLEDSFERVLRSKFSLRRKFLLALIIRVYISYEIYTVLHPLSIKYLRIYDIRNVKQSRFKKISILQSWIQTAIYVLLP